MSLFHLIPVVVILSAIGNSENSVGERCVGAKQRREHFHMLIFLHEPLDSSCFCLHYV